MRVPAKRGPFFSLAAILALSALAYSVRADEIRLKDGKKLYGVIVAYEENMFKEDRLWICARGEGQDCLDCTGNDRRKIRAGIR